MAGINRKGTPVLPLSWNEIRARAGRFATEWHGRGYEKGDTGQFYHQFFEVFGQKPRDVNIYFEKRVKLGDKAQGFIDLFWPGKLLVEQKSQGPRSGDGLLSGAERS